MCYCLLRFTAFETREHYAIAMEYLPGGELFDYVQKRGGLTEDNACDLFGDIARAVQHCHEVCVCTHMICLLGLVLGQ